MQPFRTITELIANLHLVLGPLELDEALTMRVLCDDDGDVRGYQVLATRSEEQAPDHDQAL